MSWGWLLQYLRISASIVLNLFLIYNQKYYYASFKKLYEVFVVLAQLETALLIV